jgi:thiamine biosynthesis lipoprotein
VSPAAGVAARDLGASPGPRPAPTPDRFAVAHLPETAMGGRLVLRITTQPGRDAEAAHDLALAARRVRAWASILTRHGADSALLRLNADRRREVPVGPTLAAALGWAADAAAMTGGVVDATLLDARLAAERGAALTGAAAGADEAAARGLHPLAAGPSPRARWALVPSDPRTTRGRGAVVIREPGLRFDLDGVAKGWIADRALALLGRHPGAIVDADGDVALRVAPGDRVTVGVGDPRDPEANLAILALEAPAMAPAAFGIATSGISIHRWEDDGRESHHLIDPRTGAPAATDVVQATAIAGSAKVAEALAKTAVILGAVDGLDFLARAGAAGAVLLLRDGRVVALPATTRLLA